MKKITIIFSITVLLLTNLLVNAKSVSVIKENQGPNGFKYVNEIHSQTAHNLTCREPGYEVCSWMNHAEWGALVNGNGIDYLVDDLVAYTERQMAVGINSGKTVFPGQVLVIWHPTEFGYKITILNGNDFPEYLK